MLESTENKISTNDTNILMKKKKSIKIIDDYPNGKIINIISELLKIMCKNNNTKEINNQNILSNKKIKLFMLRKIPSISINDYLLRLSKYSKLDESTVVFILIYIDRLCHNYNLKINNYNIFKLILAAMVVAIKFNEDEYYTSDFYAKLGGISKLEMNLLEYEFVTMINFNLFIKEDLFYQYYDLLKNYENKNDKDNNDDKNNN